SQPDLAAQLLPGIEDLVERGLEATADLTEGPLQRQPLLGQEQLLADAVEEPHAQLRLQRRDAVAHGGAREAQDSSRARHPARRRDVVEDTQLVEVDFVRSHSTKTGMMFHFTYQRESQRLVRTPYDPIADARFPQPSLSCRRPVRRRARGGRLRLSGDRRPHTPGA